LPRLPFFFMAFGVNSPRAGSPSQRVRRPVWTANA
jgi:hypothetical protein